MSGGRKEEGSKSKVEIVQLSSQSHHFSVFGIFKVNESHMLHNRFILDSLEMDGSSLFGNFEK